MKELYFFILHNAIWESLHSHESRQHYNLRIKHSVNMAQSKLKIYFPGRLFFSFIWSRLICEPTWTKTVYIKWENKLLASGSAPARCIMLRIEEPSSVLLWQRQNISRESINPGLKFLQYFSLLNREVTLSIYFFTLTESSLLVADFSKELKCKWIILLCISKTNFSKKFLSNSFRLERRVKMVQWGGSGSKRVPVQPERAAWNCVKKDWRGSSSGRYWRTEFRENPTRLSSPNPS